MARLIRQVLSDNALLSDESALQNHPTYSWLLNSQLSSVLCLPSSPRLRFIPFCLQPQAQRSSNLQLAAPGPFPLVGRASVPANGIFCRSDLLVAI